MQFLKWTLLWVWLLNNYILFIGDIGPRTGLFWAGLVEQLTGICCDHVLFWVSLYLWKTTPKEEKELKVLVTGASP